MNIKDILVIVSFLALFSFMIYTLYNINTFMKSEAKCESGFEIVSKCGCSPDSNFDSLFTELDKYGAESLKILKNGTK